MSIINNGLLLASGADAAVGYQISRSLRFNSADSAYLSRTPGSAGNQQTWTLSMWVKRSKLGSTYRLFDAYTSASDTGYTLLGFSNEDKLIISGWSNNWKITTQVFRDVSAWYHIVVAFDVTQATGSNRIKFYVNGTQITTFDTDVAPAQNTNHAVNGAIAHAIGRYSPGPSQYFDGYIADVYLLDGTATTPSTFAETDAITGQWVPKTPTGISYGTNGFRLTFSDNSGTTSTTLGKDAAGSNNWTPNNFSVASGSGNDSLVDTPTSYGTDTGAGGEVRGNYCTWNPLKKVSSATAVNGNLAFTVPTDGGIASTFAVSSGKWYWEVVLSSGRTNLGLATTSWDPAIYPGYTAQGWSYSSFNGNKVHNASSTSYGASFTTGDVIGVAFDADAGTLTFYKSGTSQGQAFSGITGAVYPPALGADGGTTGAGDANFGQRQWAYAAPAGFKALCDTNLPAPVVAKPSTVMDVKLYTGNGSTQTISGLGFSPDFVWIKDRSQGNGHGLFDVIRGATKGLFSNLTNAEITASNSLTSFDSTGFSTGSGGTTFSTNINGNSYVGWCWDAGSSTVTNNVGSITSSVRANASAGFSIVTYTGTGSGATVGHGLGVAPAFIVVKNRGATGDWFVYHSGVASPASSYLLLNGTDAVGSSSSFWGSPNSTTFGIKANSAHALNNNTYVA